VLTIVWWLFLCFTPLHLRIPNIFGQNINLSCVLLDAGRNVLLLLTSRLVSKSCLWRTRIQITPKWSTKLAVKATFKKISWTERALFLYRSYTMCTSNLFIRISWLIFCLGQQCKTPLEFISSSLLRARNNARRNWFRQSKME
jgi:hypothetical protein